MLWGELRNSHSMYFVFASALFSFSCSASISESLGWHGRVMRLKANQWCQPKS